MELQEVLLVLQLLQPDDDGWRVSMDSTEEGSRLWLTDSID